MDLDAQALEKTAENGSGMKKKSSVTCFTYIPAVSGYGWITRERRRLRMTVTSSQFGLLSKSPIFGVGFGRLMW
ncbi:hypothetical protein JCM14469_06820 [Desulfatiferula olefinivorans]